MPRALSRLDDPFFTNLIWAPSGTDLAWVTWTPAVAVAAWPVTALFGVVPAYNALAVAAPATAAWTSFLFLRELCGRSDVALLGGLTFGFSSFVTVHTIGHLHLTLCFLIPVCAWLALLRYRRRLSRMSFVASVDENRCLTPQLPTGCSGPHGYSALWIDRHEAGTKCQTPFCRPGAVTR